jgi:hypothetical protein
VKTLQRTSATTALALLLGGVCFGQHYTQTNLRFQHVGGGYRHRCLHAERVGSIPRL